MRKILAASALVLALAVTVLPATDAGAWGRRDHAGTQTTTGTTTQTSSQAKAQLSVLNTLLDKVALTDIELSPFGRMILNGLLRAVMPSLCPVIADLAAPAFQSLVLTGCQGVAAAPDPYAALLDFLPLACSLGDVIFPDYKEILAIGCGLLL